MHLFSFPPLLWIDLVGSLSMVVLSMLCMRQALVLYRLDQENPLNTYLLWLVSALFIFCLFRSVGHLVKHVLLCSNQYEVWAGIAPLSGGLNTAAFIIIFAITLFFRDVLIFMNRMTRDRSKIETTSRQLLSLNREIEEVASDRTKAEMALNLAHEIRNPVMIISGLLKRLRKTAVEGAMPDEQYHREIKQQITQLEALVARFEGMQEATREHFQEIRLNGLLNEAVAKVHAEAEKKDIELEFVPSRTSQSCHGDRQYLTAAFLHLFRNGIEACQSGDRIEVSTEAADIGTRIVIEDDGPGIPQHVLEHIFEPFYSTRDGATGMGLSYVQQIINEHRGEIHIDSTRGKGTRVEVFIPGFLNELE